MSGIYIHIPFCKRRCLYCDFFSSTNQEEKERYVEAINRELVDRTDYLQGQSVETIYFGGGTPSQVSAGDFEKLFDTLRNNYNVAQSPEITLEANPDDLTPAYAASIRHLPFNRISLGIQSFCDRDLAFLNRRHKAESAINAIHLLQENGFDNISIDLMFGLPGQTPESWEENLEKAIALPIRHISAYHLIYEEDTPLYSLLKKNVITPIDEELSVQLFNRLIDSLTEAGFEHYEIANFAKPGYRSRHNSAYWNGTHYLGIGASAHSYNGVSRQWNRRVAGAEYLEQGFEIEPIDEKTAYEDFIITRLRTMEGIDLEALLSLFGGEKKAYCLQQAQKHIKSQLLEIAGNRLRLTRKGLFVSDGIMADLF
jgi:oxygen-independent coproporphyrinogen-3 oxidase